MYHVCRGQTGGKTKTIIKAGRALVQMWWGGQAVRMGSVCRPAHMQVIALPSSVPHLVGYEHEQREDGHEPGDLRRSGKAVDWPAYTALHLYNLREQHAQRHSAARSNASACPHACMHAWRANRRPQSAPTCTCMRMPPAGYVHSHPRARMPGRPPPPPL